MVELYNRKSTVFGLIFICGLALTMVVAIIAPRFLAFWPGIIGTVSLIAYPFVFNEKPEFPKTIFLWALAILFLAGASSLWAIDGGYVVSRTLKVALIILPGIALVAVAQSIPLATVRPYLKIMTGIAFGAALVCSIDMAGNFPFHRLTHGMAQGEEVAGATLNRSVIALLALFFTMIGISGTYKNKILQGGLFTVFGFLLFLTQSQSAQLGFILATLCYFFFPYSHKKIWMAFTAILVIGVLSAPFLAIGMFDHFAATVTKMPFLGQGAGFGGERLEIWDKIGRYALKQPFYGFGMEATRMITDFDTMQIYREGITELHPHNFAIQLWIEFGLIGALFGSSLLVFLTNKFSRLNFNQARIALPCFMILLTAISFGYGLWQSWLIGLIMVTISIALLSMRLYENNQTINKEIKHDG